MNITTPLTPTNKRYSSYSGHCLKVEGCVTLPTTYKDKTLDVEYTVVHTDKDILLSGKVSKHLGLIERVHTIAEIDKYPELKETTGTLPGIYSLKIDPSVKPVVHGPRRQPKALAAQIEDKLTEMEQAGQIAKVTTPTDWVSSMVVVVKRKKKTPSLRICLDPKDLNVDIKREHYPIPTVEEVVASFPQATVMSVLDARNGFLQIKLDYEPSLLTTFNTPIGRYRWLRLPFGITSAPEIFQRIMDNMLEGITGAKAIMDDIFIGGENEADHDAILKKVVPRATEYNLRLNFDKCRVKKSEVKYKYAGHIMNKNGLKPDPDKVKALRDMPIPKSKEDVRRFLGMIQYLAKFIPGLSDIDAPLRDVVKKNTDFYWEKPQQVSLDKLTDLCSSAPVLANLFLSNVTAAATL
ncbi:hypothetical protein SNE40_001065 [Patella caerulea]|uniref:Reverse transcriptase domain-containing protein n=1 Tax=Patella caerulea TaxID=87958 RepID=A0AAN8KMV0_PATCE